MKRIGLVLGALFLGIILFLRPHAEAPPAEFRRLSISSPGRENEPRDELRLRGAAVVPALVAVMKHRSLAESPWGKAIIDRLPASLAQRFPQAKPSTTYATPRVKAVWMLGELGPVASNAVPDLEGLRISAPEDAMQIQATIALAKIQPGSRQARSNLLAELHATFQSPRFFAAIAIGALDPTEPELLSAAIGALHDADGGVRANAAWSIAQWGPAARLAAPRLRELLNDDSQVRFTDRIPANAAYALVRVAPDQSPAAVQAMLRLQQQGVIPADSTMIPFVLALGPAATNAIPWLEECLTNRASVVSGEVAMVGLWRIQGQATPEMLALLPKLSSPAAIRALGELGPLAAAAEARLQEILADGGSSALQREAAAEALRKIRGETSGR